jgi:serine/threonine protein kinase
MPVTSSVESFLSVLKRSGLVEPDQLKRLFKQLNEHRKPLDDPQGIADELVAQEFLTHWQAEKLLRGRYKGFFLSKYRLLSLLGRGGMSSVYLAEHVMMRRRCAVKVLPFKHVQNASSLARFHRESQAVAALDHRNIVRAYDVDVDNDVEKNQEVHFLVMEYIDGHSLQELVRNNGPLGFVDAADYLRQAADGLQHAHQAGMVHRDIKPGNLLVDLKGVVKILDLGLARFFDERDEKSLTVEYDQKVLGTVDYLAPEQALDSHTVDARADIYGLGCTFYFLLTGRPPFTEGSLAQRLVSHQINEPPAIKESRPDVPAGLVDFVNKMMAKDPDQRYQTAEELSHAVSTWLQHNSGSEKYHHIPFSPESDDSDSSHEPPVFPQQILTADESDPDNLSEILSQDVSAVIPEEESEQISFDSSPESEQGLETFLSSLESSETTHTVPDAGNPESEAKETPQLSDEPVGPSVPVAKVVTHPVTTETSETIPIARPVDRSSPPQRPVAEPVQPEQAEPEELHFDFEEFPGSSTQKDPVPLVTDTIPADLTESSKVGRRAKSRKQNNTAKIALLSAGALFLIVGIVFAISSFLGDDPESAQNIVSQNTKPKNTVKPNQGLPRIISVGPDGDFKSIGEAIAKVKETFVPRSSRDRQIIKVQGGRTYPERIVIDNSDKSFDDIRIHLLSDGDQPARLEPAAGDEPIVVLNGINHFTLDGFELHADGGKTAVELSGILIGTTLSNLNITGFSDSGIAGNGPVGQGVQGGKIVLEKIDFRPSTSNAVGIRFHSAGSDPSQVVVSHCRFWGRWLPGFTSIAEPLLSLCNIQFFPTRMSGSYSRQFLRNCEIF